MELNIFYRQASVELDSALIA